MTTGARLLHAATVAGTALSLGCLALGVDNLRRLRTPSVHAPAPTEPVAVLVPARNEAATIGSCLTALRVALDAVPDGRIIVLDDGSTDATAEVARRVAAGDSRVRVLTGAPLPSGWLGKPWACQQLAEAVPDAGVLVFVDADVRLESHALTASVDLLRSAGLALVSPYPRQEAVTWAERLVQPLLQWSWLTTLPLGLAERSPLPSLAAANGQLMAVDAKVYGRVGGHASVRAEVLDDVALLRAVKRAGARGAIADGTTLATCRMYAGWPTLREGYAKSLWSAFGSRRGAAAAVGLLGLAYVLPAAAAVAGSRVGLLGYAAGITGRVLVASRVGGRVLPDALCHPASVLALGWLTVDSWRRRASVQWKGRPVAGTQVPPA